MAQSFTFRPDKMRAVILHTVNACPTEHLGAVKLHKVLYFLDMLTFAVRGHPVTGSVYRKRPFGPTCQQLLPTLDMMCREGLLDIRDVDYFGFTKKEYQPKVQPDAAALTNDEAGLLHDVIEFVCLRNTAKAISEISHQLPWEMAEFGGVIPYESAYLLFPPEEPADDPFAGFEEDIASFETARSTGQKLATRSFRDFRREAEASH